jgi:beta-glucosidase
LKSSQRRRLDEKVGQLKRVCRHRDNDVIDEHTFRELYLLPSESAIEQRHPGSVMCSYNRLNADIA